MSTQQLPTATQLQEHRTYLQNRVVYLKKRHGQYKKAEAETVDPEMALAINSSAANIWDTAIEVEHILGEFNNMYPEEEVKA